MIDRKKLLLRSLTPILACLLLGGIGFAATPAAQNSTTAQSSTSTQTAPMTAAQKRAAKKAAKKEAKKEAKDKKAAEANSAPVATKTASATASPSAKTRASHHSTMAGSAGQPSANEIASAKAKGMVWVNTESKVYHTGGKYYGNTKHGQFMSAADAQRAGYKAAKR